MTTFLLSAVVGSWMQSGIAPIERGNIEVSMGGVCSIHPQHGWGLQHTPTAWVGSEAYTHSMGVVCSIYPQHGWGLNAAWVVHSNLLSATRVEEIL